MVTELFGMPKKVHLMFSVMDHLVFGPYPKIKWADEQCSVHVH